MFLGASISRTRRSFRHWLTYWKTDRLMVSDLICPFSLVWQSLHLIQHHPIIYSFFSENSFNCWESCQVWPMWQHLQIRGWFEDPCWKVSYEEPNNTWSPEAAQWASLPPPLGHQQGGVLADILNQWDTDKHFLQQLQELHVSNPYVSWIWKDMQLKRWSWKTHQHHTSHPCVAAAYSFSRTKSPKPSTGGKYTWWWWTWNQVKPTEDP